MGRLIQSPASAERAKDDSSSKAERAKDDSSSKRNQDNDLPDQRVISAAQEIEDKARFFWPPDFFGQERWKKESMAGLLKRLSSDVRFETSFSGAVLIQHAKSTGLNQEREVSSDLDGFKLAMKYWQDYWTNIIREFGEDEDRAHQDFLEKKQSLQRPDAKVASTISDEPANEELQEKEVSSDSG